MTSHRSAPRGSGAPAFSSRNPLPLEQLSPVKVVTLANFLSKQFLKGPAQEHGLNVTEWRVLAMLASFPDIAATDICDRTGLEKMTVSLAVASLLKKKIVVRNAHPSDRRRLLLRLTSAGEWIYDAIAPKSHAFVDALLLVLTPTEQALFMSVLLRLEERARELAEPGTPS